MLLIRKIWVLLLLLLPLSLRAQVDEALEQWVEESGSEESAAELHDLLLQLADQPVNLNDTVSIASLPFLSPFQVRALKNYIILHGQLWSLKELRMVPGFDSATVALIGPLVKVEPYDFGADTIRWWREWATLVPAIVSRVCGHCSATPTSMVTMSA